MQPIKEETFQVRIKAFAISFYEITSTYGLEQCEESNNCLMIKSSTLQGCQNWQVVKFLDHGLTYPMMSPKEGALFPMSLCHHNFQTCQTQES